MKSLFGHWTMLLIRPVVRPQSYLDPWWTVKILAHVKGQFSHISSKYGSNNIEKTLSKFQQCHRDCKQIKDLNFPIACQNLAEPGHLLLCNPGASKSLVCPTEDDLEASDSTSFKPLSAVRGYFSSSTLSKGQFDSPFCVPCFIVTQGIFLNTLHLSSLVSITTIL